MGFLKKLKIRTQILIALSCLLVIMLTIIYSMYIQTSGIVIKDNNQYSEDIIHKFTKATTQNYEEVSQIMLNLGFDPTTQNFLTQTDNVAAYDLSKELDRKIISLKAGRKGIDDIILIGANGTRYSLNGGVGNIQHLENEINHHNNVYVSGIEKFFYSGNKGDYIVFAQNLFSNGLNTMKDGIRIGEIAVIVNVNSMFFNKDLANTEESVGFYLIDRYGHVFPDSNTPDITKNISTLSKDYKPDQKLSGTIGGVQGAVQIEQITQIKATILSFVPEKVLLSELSTVRSRSIMIILIALLLMALPFAVIANNILSPIQMLVKFMNRIKAGNLNDLTMKLQLEGNIEMKVVAEKLNGMLGEINLLTNQLVDTTTNLYEAEIEKEKSASAFLRSQINPHFLYNTLESIKGVAYEEGNSKIVAMTNALGKLFHYSIKGSGFVTLDQELTAIKNYVFLQHIRFEERFDVRYSFTEEALLLPVMKMILQPLVENAIFHGLEPKTSKGMLIIQGEIVAGDTLIIQIRDDGIGVESHKLQEIKNKLLEGTSLAANRDGYITYNDSIGIFNVNNRLRLAYGLGHGLTFESELGIGTCITLTMPTNIMQLGGTTDV
ncbi:HAMP domain-containing protein [Paenibacillus psychroresistens]|uniref:HAMP domain-containing protein n=1 Tax=Paenibacillus psychroresistens TaxID=1778678 RepID=A0A6B8RDL9_9BACL|nr:histidine kinase [Paenibacillus psychroresistens]QGQ94531.1 HAMP domain-containing protein [Paenibacillus psychroresistens]